MIELRATDEFEEWLSSLRDRTTHQRVLARLRRFADGNHGDTKNIGGGLAEMKLDFGSGWRIYYTRVSDKVYLLLVGGSKSNQKRDIEKARKMIEQL